MSDNKVQMSEMIQRQWINDIKLTCTNVGDD